VDKIQWQSEGDRPPRAAVMRWQQNWRKLNSVTEPDPHPLPWIDDLLDKVGKAKYLTKLDMAKGYHQASGISQDIN